MIPKVIHYCWFGGKPLPSDVKKCIKSWKKLCPDYKIIRWDESNFDVNSHPFTQAAYAARAWAFVSDYVRLRVVYDNGGIYLDTDVELLKSLEPLRKYQCYIGVQQCEHLCNTGLGFGAVKSNPVVGKMLEKYNSIDFSAAQKEEIACPYLNNSVLCDMGYIYTEDSPIVINETLVLPPKYLDPIAPGDGMKFLKSDKTISIHHYSASWMGNGTKLKRRFIRLIGQEHVTKAKRIINFSLKAIGLKRETR